MHSLPCVDIALEDCDVDPTVLSITLWTVTSVDDVLDIDIVVLTSDVAMAPSDVAIVVVKLVILFEFWILFKHTDLKWSDDDTSNGGGTFTLVFGGFLMVGSGKMT